MCRTWSHQEYFTFSLLLRRSLAFATRRSTSLGTAIPCRRSLVLRMFCLVEVTLKSLQGVMRREYLASAEKDLDDARDVNSNFPVVKYVCDPECYGVDWANCSNCFRTFPPSSVDAVVINSEIHSIQELLPSQWTLPAAAAPENLVRVTDLLSGFLMSHRHPFIWVTGPETPVAPYGTAAVDSWAVGGTGPRLYGIPVLDFHNLTTKCTWANCTPDGAHRSRFFCLLKAQILLNTFCEEFM